MFGLVFFYSAGETTFVENVGSHFVDKNCAVGSQRWYDGMNGLGSKKMINSQENVAVQGPKSAETCKPTSCEEVSQYWSIWRSQHWESIWAVPLNVSGYLHSLSSPHPKPPKESEFSPNQPTISITQNQQDSFHQEHVEKATDNWFIS